MFRKFIILLIVQLCACATTAKFDYRQNDMNVRGTTDQAKSIMNMAADAELKRAKAYAIIQCAQDRLCLRKMQDNNDIMDALAEAAEAAEKAKAEALKKGE